MSEHLDKAKIVKIDTVGTITYIGSAPIGTLVTDPKWSIKKIDTTNPVTISWAGGTPIFNFIWNDRASYTYS